MNAAQAGNKDPVARFHPVACPARQDKRQHAPVDQVAPVALGGILLGYVGPAAQNLLAGSRLLTGGTVAGLHGKDHRTYAGEVFQPFQVKFLKEALNSRA